MTTLIFSTFVEMLLVNANDLNWGISRIEDEFGLEISAGVEASAGLGVLSRELHDRIDNNSEYDLQHEAQRSTFGLGLQASCGIDGRIGGYGSVLYDPSTEDYDYSNSIEMSGRVYAGATAGILIESSENPILSVGVSSSFGGGLRGEVIYDSPNSIMFKKLKLSAFVLGNYGFFANSTSFDRGEKITNSLIIEDEDVYNIFSNTATNFVELFSLGNSAVNCVIDNNDLGNDLSNFMSQIYQMQNNDLPVSIDYSTDIEAINEAEIEIDIPIPPFFKFKLELEFGNYVSYKNVAKGSWVKGMPYLRSEVVDLPSPDHTFPEVIDDIWDGVTGSAILDDLVDLLFGSSNTGSIGGRDYEVIMNALGSKLILSEDSIPDTITDAQYVNWDWADEPASQNISEEIRQEIIASNRELKRIRRELEGLDYGIGGFFKIDPENFTFEDTTFIKIYYTEDEVADIDETSLAIYYEDEVGHWYYLPSTVNADSNFVQAQIYNFTTYTLAPTLPQGEYSLFSTPDSFNGNVIYLSVS